MQSPLRYPGGKSNFVKTVDKIIQTSNLIKRPFYEPYAGSAAISLGLLGLDTIKSATILEKDPLLYSFWKAVIEKPEELIERYDALPISLDTWHELHPLLKVTDVNNSNFVQLGLAALFFNRCNFSGILKGGPIGGHSQNSAYKIDCRTNKLSISKKIRDIANYSLRINVEFGDAIDLIKKHSRKKNVLFYIDPPYYMKGESLYRHYYKHSDHKRLAEALSQAKFPWILSYDSHHVIEYFYENFFISKHEFQYSAGGAKKNDELLISNFKLSEEMKDW